MGITTTGGKIMIKFNDGLLQCTVKGLLFLSLDFKYNYYALRLFNRRVFSIGHQQAIAKFEADQASK